MKKTRLLALASWVFCLTMATGCIDDNADDALPRLKVDKNQVQVIQNGRLSNGNIPTVTVIANKGYQVTSQDEWLSVDKPEGTGRIDLSILAEPNETGAVREGHLTIVSRNLSELITVRQTLDEDTDDGNEIGFVYFYDDFEWAQGGTDAITDKAAGDARNIYTWGFEANGYTNPLPTFQSTYDDMNSNARTVYVMKGFLKFDKTNTLTAISPLNLNIPEEKTTNVTVTFKAARHGSDGVNLVVAIDGEGEIEGGQYSGDRMVSEVLPITSESYTWSDISVNISSITNDTKIWIGDQTILKDNINNQGTFRWYIDDLKIVKAEL